MHHQHDSENSRQVAPPQPETTPTREGGGNRDGDGDDKAGGNESFRKALEAARFIEQSLGHAPSQQQTLPPHQQQQQQHQDMHDRAPQQAPAAVDAEFEWSSHGIDPSLISVPPPTPADQMPFMREIEINNLRNLNILTKSSTLKEIEHETNASLTTRGRYYNMRRGEQPMAPDDPKPLTLFIAAETPQSLDQVLVKVGEIINMQQQKNFLVEKVHIGIDDPMFGFNVPANVIGPRGSYVKHITNTCPGTRVHLKGRGSAQRGMEDEDPDEPMYLHISGVYKNQMERARKLAESLIGKVKRDYAQFVERKKNQRQQAPPPPFGQHPGMGGAPPMPPYGGVPPPYPYQGHQMPGYPPQAPPDSASEPAPPGMEPAPPGMEPAPPGMETPMSSAASAEAASDYYNQYYAYYNQQFGPGAPIPPPPAAPVPEAAGGPSGSSPSAQLKRDREESTANGDEGTADKRPKLE